MNWNLFWMWALILAWLALICAPFVAHGETRATIDPNTGKSTWTYIDRSGIGPHGFRPGDRYGTQTRYRKNPDGSFSVLTEPLYEPSSCPRGMRVLRYGRQGC